MNLQIFLRKEGEKQVAIKAAMNKPENVANANLLFKDMAESDLARGWELTRWQIKRKHGKWKGLASEESPRLEDGDVVVLHAKKIAQ